MVRSWAWLVTLALLAGCGSPEPVRPLAVAQAGGGSPSARASSGDAASAVDGDPATWWAPSRLPAWLAVPLPEPAQGELQVAWDSTGLTLLNQLAAPKAYALEACNDSTDGRNGTWRTLKQVHSNPLRSRIARVEAHGARWVRLVVRERWAIGPQLRSLRVVPGRSPTWLIMGDSITAQAFNPAKPNRFAHAPRRPLWLGGGTGGDTAEAGARRLASTLWLLPPGAYVGLAYGTNDATHGVPVERYKAVLRQMAEQVLASGRTPVLARPPHSLNNRLPAFVAAVDALTKELGLPPGPDLYSWFRQHPEELGRDSVHPNARGEASIQRLWGEAAARALAK